MSQQKIHPVTQIVYDLLLGTVCRGENGIHRPTLEKRVREDSIYQSLRQQYGAKAGSPAEHAFLQYHVNQGIRFKKFEGAPVFAVVPMPGHQYGLIKSRLRMGVDELRLIAQRRRISRDRYDVRFKSNLELVAELEQAIAEGKISRNGTLAELRGISESA